MVNDSEVGEGNWTNFDNNVTGVFGDEDYFVPTWIIGVYVFFLSIGVCVNLGLALVLMCTKKNGNCYCVLLISYFVSSEEFLKKSL